MLLCSASADRRDGEISFRHPSLLIANPAFAPASAGIQTSDMQGRIKRKLEQQQLERMRQAGEAESPICALCHRPLGTRVEYHHSIPKSEGGTETVPVHPICHRAIHAYVSNHDLAETYADLEALRSREDMQRFLRWIRNKPADFHAPTKRTRTP